MRDARRTTLLAVLFAVLTSFSCGGGGTPAPVSPPPTPPNPDPTVAGEPANPDQGAPAPPMPPPAPDHEVELYPPSWKKVGVGQQISFGTSAIDQDLDETSVMVTAMPKSATFDALTQTVTWKPTKADMPKGTFELTVTQPEKHVTKKVTWTIDVVKRKQPEPLAEPQSPMIETVLMIHDAKRLAAVNRAWPLDKLLLVGAKGFKWQFSEDHRKKLTGKLDKKALWDSFLAALSETHDNPRLDPKSPEFDKKSFANPRDWKIVAFRPRIDRSWTELRVVYRAVKAPEPVFAMFRLRPVVEYVPALPRPPEERIDNNKVFLGMVAKRLLKNGAPNPAFVRNKNAHGRAVAQLMTDVMTFDQSKKKPYLRGFMIGIASEARMGGGSARKADGSYKSGDGWAWGAMKPFPTADGKSQHYINIVVPGFWTATHAADEVNPSGTRKVWGPVCADRYIKGRPGYAPGYDKLCRKPLGFVDMPVVTNGKVHGGKLDANNLYRDYKMVEMRKALPLEDGRRDYGEENGMTCSQCHIRNFAMHDYSDPANVDPTKGVPKELNHKIATTNFQIIASDRWEEFTLEFLKHQECRGKGWLEEFLGKDAAKGFTCAFEK